MQRIDKSLGKKHLVCLPLNAIGVLTNDKELLLILNFYRGIPTTNAPFHLFSTNPSLWQDVASMKNNDTAVSAVECFSVCSS